MRINTNVNAMIAANQMSKNVALSGNSMNKLASGLRINKAGDDAAGLAISEKMRSQIRGMEQADRNVQDGISLVQTAEGALSEAGNIAQRMRVLAAQGGNDPLSAEDRGKIEAELTELGAEMGKIASETKFNGIDLLTTVAAGKNITIQAGATAETRVIKLTDLETIATSVSALKVTDNATAQTSIGTLDTALKDISTARATLGAMQNRLEATSSNLGTATENLSAAESRIRDVDVAKEMINLSKLNILSQAAQSMVAQAKQQPEGILQLLR